MEASSEFVFLGYRVKRPWAPGPGWEPIELVCNAGDDMCEPPDGWVERWDWNRASCYATPEAAWATVTEDSDGYRLFAYDLLPFRFGGAHPPTAVPLDEIFRNDVAKFPDQMFETPAMTEIGYDVAEKNLPVDSFPYSPLVTNGFAGEFTVNLYGLIVDLAVATEACSAINEAMPEHGSHWVVRILWDADRTTG
ncbi:hypothetical protein EON81_21405 [bacterium]|nr:MAG: hypothetical protein EON81_21405 [bacterium]